MFGGASHTNLLVLKLPRTGGAYLAHLLRRHQRISFHHEYLMPHARREELLLRGRLGWPVLRTATKVLLHRAKAKDLRRFLATSTESSLVGASIDPIAEGLGAAELRGLLNPGTRVIVLTRENPLKQYISILNVRAERDAGNPRPDKSYTDDGRMTERGFHIGREARGEIARLKRQRRELIQLSEALDAPVLPLTYEADINLTNPEPLLRSLASYLDLGDPEAWMAALPLHSGAARYHKLVNDDLRRVIQNYDEVAADPRLMRYL
jgi:hypothetical protein